VTRAAAARRDGDDGSGRSARDAQEKRQAVDQRVDGLGAAIEVMEERGGQDSRIEARAGIVEACIRYQHRGSTTGGLPHANTSAAATSIASF